MSQELVLLLLDWDEDASGTADAREFRKALPVLELRFERDVSDALFQEVSSGLGCTCRAR